MSNITFVLKVFLLSAAIAAAIKYGAPYLTIPASNLGVLVAVFLPSVVMLTLFGWLTYRE